MDYWGSDSGWSMGSDETPAANNGGILAVVFADRLNAGKSLLASARQVAGESGASVTALLFGGEEAAAQELIGAGADTARYLDAIGDGGLYDAYLAALRVHIGQQQPDTVLFTADARGNSIAAQLAGALKTSLVVGANALTLDYADQTLIATQPIYGGAAVATWKLGGKPQVVTVRPGTAGVLLDKHRQGKVEPLGYNAAATVSSTTSIIHPATPAELINASVIVAGGHGAGEEGFKLIGELASLLGGVVGATKSAVKEGWAETGQQIGMLGQTVKPRLYIAVGISGTPEHLMGISEGANIVAINSDPAAPIFALADYGIVGDLYAVLPAFIERLRRTA